MKEKLSKLPRNQWHVVPGYNGSFESLLMAQMAVEGFTLPQDICECAIEIMEKEMTYQEFFTIKFQNHEMNNIISRFASQCVPPDLKSGLR